MSELDPEPEIPIETEAGDASEDNETAKPDPAASAKRRKNKNKARRKLRLKLDKLNQEICSMSNAALKKAVLDLRLKTSGVPGVLQKRLFNHRMRFPMADANIDPEETEVHCIVAIQPTVIPTEHDGMTVFEIIEFPAVIVEVPTGHFRRMFRAYCKPKLATEVPADVTRRTGITQDNIVRARDFPIVMERFEEWLEEWEMGIRYTFCMSTTGNTEFNDHLRSQCELYNIPVPSWGRQWVDVTLAFKSYYGMEARDLHAILRLFSMRFRPPPLLGLDMAQCMGFIMKQMMDDGCPLNINARLDRSRPTLPPLCLMIQEREEERRAAADNEGQDASSGDPDSTDNADSTDSRPEGEPQDETYVARDDADGACDENAGYAAADDEYADGNTDRDVTPDDDADGAADVTAVDADERAADVTTAEDVEADEQAATNPDRDVTAAEPDPEGATAQAAKADHAEPQATGAKKKKKRRHGKRRH